MTPRAATDPGHARTLRRKQAPHVPRRVSGPVDGRVAPKTSPPRPVTTPRVRPARRPTVGARLLAFIFGLPDHPLLDRAVRGRAWIPILGILLAGIVAMQVEVLKLGASMGRSLSLGTTLQSRNELLRASVASLSDEQRVERLAAGMGMIMPAPGTVSFLSAQPGNSSQAASNIHAPDPGGFLAALPSYAAVEPATSSSAAEPATSSNTPDSPTSGTGTDSATANATPTSAATTSAATTATNDSAATTATNNPAATTATNDSANPSSPDSGTTSPSSGDGAATVSGG